MNQTNLVITTQVRVNEHILEMATNASNILGVPWTLRSDRSFDDIFAEYSVNRILAAYDTGWRLLQKEPLISYSYHPNMAIVRLHNLLSGQRDLFADSTALRSGETHLDCTAGFCAEAALAAYLVGDCGSVIALESDPVLALMTEHGLKSFRTANKTLKHYLGKIELVHANYNAYLDAAPNQSYDVVYFDPFFDERLWGSQNALDPIRAFGDLQPLQVSAVHRALSVARKRVVIKHPWKEPLPAELLERKPQRIETRKGRLVYSIFDAGT